MSNVTKTALVSDTGVSESGREWKTVQLREVARRRSENIDPKKADLDRHVGLEHITPDNPVPSCERLDRQSSTKRRFLPNDVLFAKLRPYLRKAAQADFEGACTSEIIPIIAGDSINSKFLLYRLSSKKAFDYAIRTSIGTRMPRTSWKLFRHFEFELPPLDEQRKIASVLLTVDRAIQKTEAIIAQAKRVKRGLAQELFRRGPDGSKSEETRFGPVLTEIPVHWKRAKIGDLCVERQLGTTERGATESAEHVGLIKMGNLSFGTWNLAEVEQIDHDAALVEKYQLRKGDLLFNTRNAPNLVGKTAVWSSDTSTIYDNNLLRLRFDERIYASHFVNDYLSHSIGRRQLRSRVHGTTSVAAIYWSDLKTVEIPLPPKEEQQEIAETLRSVDAAIQQSQQDAGRLRCLKRGLMQDLLVGRVRTAGANIDVLDEVRAHG